MECLITKNNTVIEQPKSEVLLTLYNVLKMHQQALDGSQVYQELVDAYMFQEFLINELGETKHENNQIKSA